MAETCEDAGSKAVELNSPTLNENEEDVITEEEDLQNAKIALNRSESCGSILQGNNGMSRMKNLSRRVSFPSDDKLISGYNEPRNPWEHAHETTTEELIQTYTQACQTWNVRPITKLLVQLQEIKDFTVRANSLTLKGERLETRVVETLETIFKRVQFITIDLEATNLDEDAAAALFDMIEYYESAVNVLVGFNKNLGNRGWQAAAHMMRKMSCLRLFDGHSVPLSIQASPFVGRALRLSNTLVTLHLENAMLTGRPVLLIVAALRMNTTLRELFLADNRLSPLDSLQLANLLKFNRVLQLLDLRNNPIQDMGLGHLCAGLMAQSGSAGLNGATGGLQTLVLWNNQISHESMPKLAMALRYTVSLSTLNLGQNVLSDDGMLRLKEGLLQNHSLIRLGLVGTKLTDEGGVAIAEYLAESPRIIRLDLRNNDIKVAGLMALSLAFKINHSLLRLDIDKPNKKDALKELAAKQESLLNDLVSYAQRNKQIAIEKAQALQQRQEEARLAHFKEESGLRYMDMTNSTNPSSTSTPVTMETSVNNSNNQSPLMQNKSDQKQESRNEKQSSGTSPVLASDADDTPEDSPEFLPRSSVSYHQVAPVMLSGSEMAKRAAAARLDPVPEQTETCASTNLPKTDGIADKMLNDAFTGAKITLSEMGQGEPTSSSTSTPERGAIGPKNGEEQTIDSQGLSEEVNVEIGASNISINSFAEQLTSSVMISVSTCECGTTSHTNTISTTVPNDKSTTLPDLGSEVQEVESEMSNDSKDAAVEGTSMHIPKSIESIPETSPITSVDMEGTSMCIPKSIESITEISPITSADMDSESIPAISESTIESNTNPENVSDTSTTTHESTTQSSPVITVDMESTTQSSPIITVDMEDDILTVETEDVDPLPAIDEAETNDIDNSNTELSNTGTTGNEEVKDEVIGQDVLNGNVPTEMNNTETLDNQQNTNHDQALKIVTGIFDDMGLFGNAGLTTAGDVFNGNITHEGDEQSKTGNCKTKGDNVSDNSGVCIEVSHFDLSQFPKGDQ